MEKTKRRTAVFVTAFVLLIATLLVLGTLWIGSRSQKDTDKAVRAVSRCIWMNLPGGVNRWLKTTCKTISGPSVSPLIC